MRADRTMPMARKPKPPRDDPKQSKRFIKMAREAEADEDSEGFKRTFKKIVPPKKTKPHRPNLE